MYDIREVWEQENCTVLNKLESNICYKDKNFS